MFQKLSASDALKQALRDAGCADQVFEDGEGEEEEEQGGDGESETESFTEVFQTAARQSFEQLTTHVGSKLLRTTQFLYERTIMQSTLVNTYHAVTVTSQLSGHAS